MSKFFESKFAKALQKFGEKLGSNKALTAISGGLMETMGLMLVGAIFQIIATLLSLFNVIENGSAIYNILITPFNMTMGIISVIGAFKKSYFL